MAEVTAALVKELRDKTGAGVMDCKPGLGDSGGAIESAAALLCTKGVSPAAQKGGAGAGRWRARRPTRRPAARELYRAQAVVRGRGRGRAAGVVRERAEGSGKTEASGHRRVAGRLRKF